MFCSKCGHELVDEAVVCINCGCAVNGVNSISKAAVGEDTPNGLLNVLGFLVPLAGLIMYCVMQSKTPRKANQIGMFSLIGFIINFILIIAMSM